MDMVKHKLRCLRKYEKQRLKNKERGCRFVISTLESRELRKKGLKYCPQCKDIKEIKEFNKSKSNFGVSTHCTLCSRILGKKYRNKDKAKENYQRKKEHFASKRLQLRFGITLDDYDIMLNKQEGKCMICEKTEKQNGKRFAVDHNHTTNTVRDLLCANCNAAVGFLQENVDIAKQAVTYIERWI